MKLTEKQKEALRALVNGPRWPWDFGSTTVNRLRKAGLCKHVSVKEGRMLSITDAGRAALEAA